MASVLQQATVKITTNTQCKTSYTNLVPSMLCAAAPGKDSCQVTWIKNEKYYKLKKQTTNWTVCCV